MLISSDHTRPVPSHIITPIILRRIRSVNPDARVRILVATGFHRPSTREELINKYGQEIVDNEEIVMHISTNDDDMVKIGQLPSGGDCIINKIAAEADLLIAEGFIESHFFAGFSGGRKSVLPGIASYKTIMANHSGDFINSDKARTGNLDHNPIHEDMLYAARTANLAFIVNVVLDGENTSSDLSLGTWLKPTKLVVTSLQTWHMCLRSKATSQFQQTVVSHLTKISTKLLKG